MSSSPPSSSKLNDSFEALASVIAGLSARPDRESVASELQGMLTLTAKTTITLLSLTYSVLQSIYGDDAIRLWHPPVNEHKKSNYGDGPDEGILRYEAELRCAILVIQ